MEKMIKSLSITGRIAFCVLCVEEYIKSTKNDIDFSFLENILWSFSFEGEHFDTWAYRLLEIVPEYLYEYENYKQTTDKEKSSLTEEDFNHARTLIAKDDVVLSKLLNNAYDVAMVYAYGSIPGHGNETIKICMDSVGILNNCNMPIPELKINDSLKWETNKGWGGSFDYKSLSILFTR